MKIWNGRENAMDQAMEGILLLRKDEIARYDTKYGYGLYRKTPEPGRVQIILNGGGGFGRMWPAMICDGLADAAVHGELETAPNAYTLYEVAKRIDQGRGVLFLCNHFMGDYLNNDMAVELLGYDGYQAKAWYVKDDILSARKENAGERGGLVGILFLAKLLTGAAKAGYSLEELVGLAEEAMKSMGSVSICLDDGSGELLYGKGFSGEAPKVCEPFTNVEEMAAKALELLIAELPEKGGRVHVLLNRLRLMSYTEGAIVLKAVERELKLRGYTCGHFAMGDYFDVFTQNGCILSLMLAEEKWEPWLLPVQGYDYTV